MHICIDEHTHTQRKIQLYAKHSVDNQIQLFIHTREYSSILDYNTTELLFSHTLKKLFLFTYLFWDRILLCSPSWPWIQRHSPASGSTCWGYGHTPTPLLLPHIIFNYIYLWGVWICHGINVEVRTKLSGVTSFFPWCGSWGSNPGTQAWCQTPFPTHPYLKPLFHAFKHEKGVLRM